MSEPLKETAESPQFTSVPVDNDSLSDSELEELEDGPSAADPHHRGFYLQEPQSLLSTLVRYRWLIGILALSLLAGCLLFLLSSASPPLTLEDLGGATSGREINLFRTRSAGSAARSLPSSQPQQPSFPSISQLIGGRTAPGLASLVFCAETTSRMAVMTSISAFPTAAEVGLALLSEPWCVVVIGDKKGPSYADFTAAIGRGIDEYDAKMRLTKQSDTPAKSTIDPKSVLSRIAYVDTDEQQLLPYRLSGLTPYGSFSRKNLGFLLAIHCGASVIFDVDDDNIFLPNTAATGNRDLPVDTLPAHYPSSASLDHHARGKLFPDAAPSRSSPPKTALQPVNVSVFNPYPLYGAADSWPRGFPLNYVRPTLRPPHHYDSHCITQTRHCLAVVQQMLANQDPDVDAIYRLTNAGGMPFYFLADRPEMTDPAVARAAPSVALPADTFAPFNAQATILTPAAFFAALLPATVHGRVSDIWRSYILETLLTYFTVDASPVPKQRRVSYSMHVPNSSSPSSFPSSFTEACVVFTAPHIYHDRNAHNYQLDFNSELPLYMQAESLVAFLSVRQRLRPLDLMRRLPQHQSTDSSVRAAVVMADVMYLLYLDLYEAGVLEEAELPYVSAWLEDLSRALRPPPDKLERSTQQPAAPADKTCWPHYTHK